ncbi:MAG: hypothetical protein QOF61_2799 [Acidobacteriota bacterium]|nr:hypothetical protein [Acidobacteriota bacterium]
MWMRELFTERGASCWERGHPAQPVRAASKLKSLRHRSRNFLIGGASSFRAVALPARNAARSWEHESHERDDGGGRERAAVDAAGFGAKLRDQTFVLDPLLARVHVARPARR